MTTLIKNAAGKILKAEGKLWDQNSLEDCDCPCFSVVDCDDLIDLKRINIKCTGWWGLEWTLTHPGGEYDTGYSQGITAAAYSASGSFLLKIPPLVKSWDYEKASLGGTNAISNSTIINNWTGLKITYDNCLPVHWNIGGPEGIFRIAEWAQFGIHAYFDYTVEGGHRLWPNPTHQLDYHTPGGTWRHGNTYHMPISIYKNHSPMTHTNGSYSPSCGLPCCGDITAGDTDWAPTNVGIIQIGLPADFQHPPETDFWDDYVLTYTEHTPVFTHELKGTE